MASRTVLVLAGLDPTGGAGLLSDISLLRKMGLNAAGIPTSLTVQSGRLVKRVEPVGTKYFNDALTSLGDTFRIDAIKVGMIFSPSIAKAVSRVLRENQEIPIVFDPVLTSSGGTPLVSERALPSLKTLIPQCTLITPNLLEFKTIADLFGIRMKKLPDAGLALSSLSGASILITGGHMPGKRSWDTLIHEGEVSIIKGELKGRRDYHGTGCALASYVTAHLVMGDSIAKAIVAAKRMLEEKMDGKVRSLDGRWFLSP